jgi:ribosomal protein L44E
MRSKKLSLLCGQCKQEVQVESTIFNVRRRKSLPHACPYCSVDLVTHGQPVKKGKSDSQKRSRAQEKRAAKRIGGRVQPASGAGRAKGDVRAAGRVRMECKLTRANSFSLKLADLEKIERETSRGEMPIFEVEFQGTHPRKRYAVIPGWMLDQLLEEGP